MPKGKGRKHRGPRKSITRVLKSGETFDSLIIVMLPMHPRYDSAATHHGAAGEERQTLDNMMKEDRELYDMARQDLGTLLKRQKRKEFGSRFKNSFIYPDVIFTGASSGRNSLDAALEMMERDFKCPRHQIKNLALNITGHGNPETIGTKTTLSLSPDDEMTGLSTMICGYLADRISPQTSLSFYILACNSAYVSYSEAEEEDEYGKPKKVMDEERVRQKVLQRSYAGRFFLGVQREMEEDGRQTHISVSGYRGFVGHTDKGKMSISSTEGKGALKTIGPDRVRFVIVRSSGSDPEVLIPQNFRFPVDGVKRSMTAEEAIDAKIGMPVLEDVSAAAASAEGGDSGDVDALEEDLLAGLKPSSPDAVDKMLEGEAEASGEEKLLNPGLATVVGGIAIFSAVMAIKMAMQVSEKERAIKAKRMKFLEDNCDECFEKEEWGDAAKEFLVENEDWLVFFESQDASKQKEVAEFLESIDLEKFQDLVETFTPLEFVLRSGLSFEELIDVFDDDLMDMISANKINFLELVKIYKTDRVLFETLWIEEFNGMFNQDGDEVKDIIARYREAKERDPEVVPLGFFTEAYERETGTELTLASESDDEQEAGAEVEPVAESGAGSSFSSSAAVSLGASSASPESPAAAVGAAAAQDQEDELADYYGDDELNSLVGSQVGDDKFIKPTITEIRDELSIAIAGFKDSEQPANVVMINSGSNHYTAILMKRSEDGVGFSLTYFDPSYEMLHPIPDHVKGVLVEQFPDVEIVTATTVIQTATDGIELDNHHCAPFVGAISAEMVKGNVRLSEDGSNKLEFRLSGDSWFTLDSLTRGQSDSLGERIRAFHDRTLRGEEIAEDDTLSALVSGFMADVRESLIPDSSPKVDGVIKVSGGIGAESARCS